MKQRWLMPLLLVALGFNLAMGLGAIYQARAAQAPASYLPIIKNGEAAPIPTTIDTLVAGDNSFISAARSPAGCNFLAYIDRDNGNLIHVVRDDGAKVTEVPLPAMVNAGVTTEADPQFVPPGPKHAAVALVIADAMYLYYTSRQPDDATGPFNVMRLKMAIPACT